MTTSSNNGIPYIMFDLFPPSYLMHSNKLYNIEYIYKTIVQPGGGGECL